MQGLGDNGEEPTVDSSYFKQHYSKYLYINEPDSVKIKRRRDKLLSDYPKMDLKVYFVKDDGTQINISSHEFIYSKNEWKYLHNSDGKVHTEIQGGFPKIWLRDGTI